jgi:hypothetical protein
VLLRFAVPKKCYAVAMLMVLMLPMAQVDNRLEVYTLANWGSTLLMY